MNVSKIIIVAAFTAVGSGVGYFCAPLLAKYQATLVLPWYGTISGFREIEPSLSSIKSVERFSSAYSGSEGEPLRLFRRQIYAGVSAPLKFDRVFSLNRNDTKDMPESTKELKDATSQVRISAIASNAEMSDRLVRLGREYFQKTLLRAQLYVYIQELERMATTAYPEARRDLAESNLQFDNVSKRLENMKAIRSNFADDGNQTSGSSSYLGEVMNFDAANTRFLSPTRQLVALEVEVSDWYEKSRQAKLRATKARAEQKFARDLLPQFESMSDAEKILATALQELEGFIGTEGTPDELLTLNLSRASIRSHIVKLQVDARGRGTEVTIARSGPSTIVSATTGGLIAFAIAFFIVHGPSRTVSDLNKLRVRLFSDGNIRPA